jgi:hypothetical protein
MEERRRTRRSVPEQAVSVTVTGNRSARLVNISSDGALLELASALNPRVEYRVTLPLIDGPVRLRARVTRCRLVAPAASGGAPRPVYQAGVEFVGVDQTLATSIAFSFPPVMIRPVRRGPLRARARVGGLDSRHGTN